MNRHWYIYKKDHHLGPFTVLNLRDLYLQGSILGDQQLWREGDPGWQPLKDYEGIRYILAIEDEKDFLAQYQNWLNGCFKEPEPESEPPDLPPVPMNDGLPPDLPPIPVEQPVVSKSPVTITEDGEVIQREEIAQPQVLLPNEDITSNFQVEVKKSRVKQLFIAVVVMVIMVAPFLGMYQWTKDSGLESLPFTPPAHAEKGLWKTVRATKQNCKIKVMMDSSGKKMWLVSNYHFPASVELAFTSLDEKILSETKVDFRAQVQLDNHLSRVDKVVFEQGDKLVSGSYRVTLKGTRTGIAATIFGSLYAYKWSKYLRVFYDPRLTFYSTTVAFIGHGDPRNFDKRLKTFFKEKRVLRLAPYKQLIQKYKTLSYTLGQMKVMIKSHITKYKRRNDLQRFEKDYATYVGGLIQNIIVEEQKMQGSSDKNKPLHKLQKDFLEHAIKGSWIGGKVVTALEKRKRRFNKRWKKSFISHFDERITKLQLKIDKKVGEVSKQLLKLQ